MSDFKKIDINAAWDLINNRGAVLVDIRDADSYNTSHAYSAQHLTNDNITQFINDNEFDCLILVMCYHGISSQGAAQYLVNQGYEEVYSIDGGFTAWHMAGLPLQSGLND